MLDRSKSFDLVCVGHISHDLNEDGFITGGAVYYASRVACKKEKKVCVLSSLKPGDRSLEEFAEMNVEVRNQIGPHTTSFKNQYVNDQRTQFLTVVADKLKTKWVIENLPEAKAVFVCPIADEIEVEILESLNSALIACSIQGWLRARNMDNRVIPKTMDWNKLRYADIVFLSYEDIEGLDGVLTRLCDLGNIIVVTDAANGADVFTNGRKYHFPSVPVEVKDPTGAGDTFAAAFILEYLDSGDIEKAATRGHLEAALLISHE